MKHPITTLILLSCLCVACDAEDDIDDAELAYDALLMDEDPQDGAAEQLAPPPSNGGSLTGVRAILMIDTTGSMTTVRSANGHRRCDDAKTMARQAASEFFTAGGAGLSIWSFNTSHGIKNLTLGYVANTFGAYQAINATPCGTGATQLADALCGAADGISSNTGNLSPLPARALILTDGYENSSVGACSGPSGKVYTVGTWQNKVAVKYDNAGIDLSSRYYVSETALEGSSELGILAPALEQEMRQVEGLEGDTLGVSAAQAPVPIYLGGTIFDNERDFFDAVATAYNGTPFSSFGLVTDNNPDYPAASFDPPGGPTQGEGGLIWW